MSWVAVRAAAVVTVTEADLRPEASLAERAALSARREGPTRLDPDWTTLGALKYDMSEAFGLLEHIP